MLLRPNSRPANSQSLSLHPRAALPVNTPQRSRTPFDFGLFVFFFFPGRTSLQMNTSQAKRAQHNTSHQAAEAVLMVAVVRLLARLQMR